MSSTFRKRLREYAVKQITEPGTHHRSDIARAFLEENPDLAELAMQELAESAVNRLIGDMCDESAVGPQATLFGGFPAAIAVGEGTVKAIEYCTAEDVEIGYQHRLQNIERARDKAQTYQESRDLFLANRRSDGETVGQVAKRLAEVAA